MDILYIVLNEELARIKSMLKAVKSVIFIGKRV